MLIAQITNPVPVDYRAAFPNVSFPPNGPDDAWLAQQGWAKVNVWRQHDSKTQKLIPCAPVYESPWVYTVAVAAKTQEELDADAASAASKVRAQRNQKLAQTDWTQGKDIPENISSKWATYRQALRDVPAQSGFPWDVQWPAQPE